MALSPPPQVLFFDVFGTCVNWRKSVVSALLAQSHAVLNSATASLASRVRIQASDMNDSDEHWNTFAQQWRESYQRFTRKLADDPSLPWVSVDEHHLTSLKELVAAWQIEGLWDYEQLRELSLVWHRLEPWADSGVGITLLNKLFYTATLSNGNLSLLSDLRAFSNIPFSHLFSAEDFGTYKPAAKVYLGAVEKMDVPPERCAMVAAHLNDLKAAKQHGLKTIYVERPGEEAWDADEVEKARSEGWVDLWVSGMDGESGFITVAEKLGVDVNGLGNAKTVSDAKKLSSSVPVGI
ncbi:haloacid dehalogenase [Ophiobolus disseminans]|uniref:Haloacid dehalogenase n=1 Tax=Ophiobolus disseminans TaxID=1469910 RepID=A0A6A6ZF40_9PLEO|nr:haloacid dehalogenase [Ophiobolus disseminans]